MADFLSDSTKQLSLKDLLRALMTKDANGNCALRYVTEAASTGPAEDCLDCDIKSLTEEQLLRKVIAVDTDGKPALRLALATE